MKKSFATLLLLPLLLLINCTGAQSNKTELWVYTSLYKDVLSKFDAAIAKDLPDIEVKWFQSGSENVAAKILAELSGGKSKADLMLTSDMFFYQELKKKNKLLPLEADALSALDPKWADPDRAYAVVRFPVMVIAYNAEQLGKLRVPQS